MNPHLMYRIASQLHDDTAMARELQLDPAASRWVCRSYGCGVCLLLGLGVGGFSKLLRRKKPWSHYLRRMAGDARTAITSSSE